MFLKDAEEMQKEGIRWRKKEKKTTTKTQVVKDKDNIAL